MKNLKMPLINCKIDLDLNLSKKCLLVGKNGDQEPAFSITDAKIYVEVVTLSTQDNEKLLEQLKSSFKRTTNWDRYESKIDRKTKLVVRLLNWSKFSRSR